MENPSRLRHLTTNEHSAESTADQRTASTSSPAEFATPEELLRHDAALNPPPPALAERLRDSLRDVPPPRASWWRRLLGKGDS